jgi:hypothetical protein
MQVYADGLIQTGAEENSVMDNPDWVWTDSNLELSFDFKNAGTPGFTNGGLSVHADLQDIRMQFYRYGEWWQPECLIEVNPADATIDVSAYVDTSKLPAAPLTLNPVDATWDEDPDITIVEGNWLCNGYLIDEWWEGLWGTGTDIAEGIENDMDAEAQGLIDSLWAEHVTPIVNSLTEFGLSFNQIRTDDHGLIVTANVDASAGITIPGDTVARNVTNAQDSGVTSNVNTLLANRASDAIVTIHPNVANQFLFAMRTALGAGWGSTSVSDSIEDVLLNPAVHGNYADNGWTVSLTMVGANTAPYATPSGAGGAPQVRMDDVAILVRNTSTGTSPVATFRGSASGINLKTLVRSGTSEWGPGFDPSSMAVSLTRTQGNADVVAFNASPSVMLPYAKDVVNYYDGNILQRYVTLAPISIGGLNVNLCTACGRYSGDQRYTETFTIG